MANDMVIPFAGQKPAQAFKVAGVQEDDLSAGIGSSYGVIGYKGKVWSLRHRGERHVVTRPDDGSPASYIDVIVLRSAPHKSKSFYQDGYDINSSDGKRPTCSALDGAVPDADITTPQAPSCAICPRNVWKVSAEGRKTRECTDYKRLAVLLLPTITKQLLGSPLMEPVFLRIPPASLNDLALFGETMSNQGFPHWTYVTRISFDPTLAHPKMVFRPLQALTDAEAPVILPLRDDNLSKRITGDDQVRPLGSAAASVTAAPPPAATIAPAQTQPQSQPQQQAAPPPAQQAVVQPAVAQPTGLGLVAAQPATTTSPSEPVAQAQPAQQEVLPPLPKAAPPPPEVVGTGLLDLTPNAADVQSGPLPTGPAQQTAADTGEATESDDELDKRINSLLQTA